MNDTITPILRPDVRMRPFDAFDGDDRFIVAVDDRHFLVSAAVAAVLEESRCRNTLAGLAERASARLGLTISPELASRVLSEGVLAVLFHPTEQRSAAECPVRLRRRLLSARLLHPLLSTVAPLFSSVVCGLLLGVFVWCQILIVQESWGGSAPPLSGPQIVCAAALTLLGVLAHELGHLAACARFGAPHGGVGIGLYWCMPVFYAEVNGAWMLPRLQRAVVDVGGIYFQCLYVLGLSAVYLTLGTPFVLEAIVWSQLLMLHTLNPVLKYDGYWLITDLTGSPNLHAQIGETAQRVWRSMRRPSGVSAAEWDAITTRALAALAGFVCLAAAYFAYVLTVLGRAIGHSLGASQHSWLARGDTPFGAWHATGELALLVLLMTAGVWLALLLARSITRIGKGMHA